LRKFIFYEPKEARDFSKKIIPLFACNLYIKLNGLFFANTFQKLLKQKKICLTTCL